MYKTAMPYRMGGIKGRGERASAHDGLSRNMLVLPSYACLCYDMMRPLLLMYIVRSTSKIIVPEASISKTP